MKKILLILQFILLLSNSYSQERFFNLYPGWVLRNVKFYEDSIILFGLDTIDMGYSNTPIFNVIDHGGGILNTYRYYNDTVDGIAIYSAQSYSWKED